MTQCLAGGLVTLDLNRLTYSIAIATGRWALWDAEKKEHAFISDGFGPFLNVKALNAGLLSGPGSGNDDDQYTVNMVSPEGRLIQLNRQPYASERRENIVLQSVVHAACGLAGLSHVTPCDGYAT